MLSSCGRCSLVISMQLGISSYTYGWAVGGSSLGLPNTLTELELLERVGTFGLDTLQIGDNLALHEMDESRRDVFFRTCADQGIRLEIGAAGMTDEHLDKYIGFAAKAKAPILRFVTDSGEYKPSPADIVALVNNHLTALKRNGIRIGIENHDRLTALELAHIMESIGDAHCGICLDCANSLGAGEGLEHVLTTLAPYTINLHFKDFSINRLPHKMGFIVTGAKPGTGLLEAARVIEILSSFRRCESAILEQWVPPEPSMDQTIAKERAWAEVGVAYLKKLTQLKNQYTCL